MSAWIYCDDLLHTNPTDDIMDKPYPSWVCAECAHEARGRFSQLNTSTMHEGTCGVCGQAKTVTEPRDYGYPDFTRVYTRLANEARSSQHGQSKAADERAGTAPQ